MKEVVWVSSDFSPPCGLSENSFVESLFDSDIGQVVSREGKRKVAKLVVNNKNYYLKKDEKKSIIEAVKFFWSNKAILSRVGRENRIVKLCVKENISVMNVVLFAERKIAGIPVQGLMLIEEVVGEEFVEIFPVVKKTVRLALAYQYGRIAGIANRQGIVCPIRAQDLIVTSRDPAEITLIDREHGKPRALRMNKRRTKRFLYRIFKANDGVIGRLEPEVLDQFMAGYCKIRPEYKTYTEGFSKQYLGR